MLFTGLWWDQLIKLDINLATRLVLSQSLEFNYGNFKTGSLETTRGLRTCCCPTGISKTYGIGCHCCHQLSAGSAVWDVSAHVPCSARNGPNANAISPWKWFSWGIPPTAVAFHGWGENAVKWRAKDLYRHTKAWDFCFSAISQGICVLQCHIKQVQMHRARADGVFHCKDYLHESAIFPHLHSF